MPALPKPYRIAYLLIAIALAACQPPAQAAQETGRWPSPLPSALPALTATPEPSATSTFLPSPTFTPSPTATVTVTPTVTLTPEPFGCLAPPEDYMRVEVNGWILNRRTMAMLEHASELYGGEIEITGYAITQGSYHDNGAASFGTHLGGGAVDLSVIRRETWTVLRDEIEPLIHALRAAGFAAWLREVDELSPGSPIHIHAIAIGDAELSQPAQDQLTGPHGYFYGYTSLPEGDPAPDRHGGPILCQWMIDLGYRDLREPTPIP